MAEPELKEVMETVLANPTFRRLLNQGDPLHIYGGPHSDGGTQDITFRSTGLHRITWDENDKKTGSEFISLETAVEEGMSLSVNIFLADVEYVIQTSIYTPDDFPEIKKYLDA